MASKGKGYRTEVRGGFEILVGRGDEDNDELTFRVADPSDFWLHVAGYSGSHVIVRNPDGLVRLPGPVLEEAARLAAWHSKARGAGGKVEVHHCRVSDVRKPRRSPRGQVRLTRWESIRVYVRDPGGE